MQIAWRAWLAERGTMQRFERPSEAEIADRARKYFRWRFREAVEALPGDSSALGTVDTTNSYGIAVPQETMEKFYGGNAKDPSTTANWRTARAEVTINGQTYVVPISDLGPGTEARKAGRVTDFTSYLMKGVGLMSDFADSPVQIKLLPPGSGPDYMTDRHGWNTEQENLRKQLFRPEPETTPWASPGGIHAQTLPGPDESDEQGYSQSFGKQLSGSAAATNP